ncbi:MAG: NTP transferase domain-containing protein [Deltaproteobacteria bacterium]|nr:NTP transferase domain-containing protein [Deltaproteobacteria bacterium]MBI3293770.1 NTP transferase domain-containing protein [Deltaproteobacteria bacterium]
MSAFGRISRGMILSAGLGTRLAPITNTIPKPLVPVLNLPNILHAVDLLRRVGIREIVINLHHLPTKIQSFLGAGEQYDVKIHYSLESTLLGTGGGVKNAEKFLAGESFVLANCDFISNIDLAPAIERHFSRGSCATMILVPPREGYTPVYCDEKSRLLGIGKSPRSTPFSGTFTGLHILSPQALTYLRPLHSGINTDLYPRLVAEKGPAFCELYSDPHWLDTGDLSTLYGSSIQLLKILGKEEGAVHSKSLQSYLNYKEAQPGVWIPIGKSLPAHSQFQAPCVVGNPETIGRGTTIGPHCVLSSETTVAPMATLSQTITLGANQLSGASTAALYFENRNLLK